MMGYELIYTSPALKIDGKTVMCFYHPFIANIYNSLAGKHLSNELIKYATFMDFLR